jgi:purine-nucleoside phosphorylase
MPLEHEVRAIHLRPAADLAERVLLPGDPHRALAVAQSLLDAPKMFNHARGLWGYTGRAADGDPLTVQSTGMGGPSAAIVAEELIALGARRLVRIGTCGALVPGIGFGELLAAEAVIPGDGASAALGADGLLRPDPDLLAGLVAAGARPVTVLSTDLFFDAGVPSRPSRGRAAQAVEMEAAALLRVSELRGAAAACVLAVTDVPSPEGGRRIEPEELAGLAERLGDAGYAALRTRRP